MSPLLTKKLWLSVVWFTGKSPAVHFGNGMGGPPSIGYKDQFLCASCPSTYLPSAVKLPKLVTPAGVTGRSVSPSSDCTYKRKVSSKMTMCFPSGRKRPSGFRRLPVLMVRGSPAPVGNKSIDPPSTLVVASTHLPSSEIEKASLSPMRTAGDPSVLRM